MIERRKHNTHSHSRRAEDVPTSTRREEDDNSLLDTLITTAVVTEMFSTPDPSPSFDTGSTGSDFGGFDGGASGGGGADSSW